jgi:hypothetical protein
MRIVEKRDREVKEKIREIWEIQGNYRSRGN